MQLILMALHLNRINLARRNEEHCFETFIIDSANSEDQLTDNLKHIMYICNRKPVDTRMYIIIITIDIYISQETLKSLLLVILPALKQWWYGLQYVLRAVETLLIERSIIMDTWPFFAWRMFYGWALLNLMSNYCYICTCDIYSCQKPLACQCVLILCVSWRLLSMSWKTLNAEACGEQ